MVRDALRWPKYATAYIRSFDRAIDRRREKGVLCTWENGLDMFYWWLLTSQKSFGKRDIAIVRILAARWDWKTGYDFDEWVERVRINKTACANDDEETTLPLIFE